MSPSPVSSPANGHVSPVVANTVSVRLPDPEPSDSDLSDAPVADIDSPSSDSPGEHGQAAADGRVDDFHDPPSSSDEDAPNDEDFDDAAEPASPGSDNGQIEAAVSASSDDSRKVSKRKAAPIHEDDFIRDNPELYGLRRSVRRKCLTSSLSS